MSLLSSYPGLLDALSGEMTPKFLSTRTPDGIPNVIPCTSLMPAGDVDDWLIFGNFLMRKSVGNLDADPRVGVLVITPALEGWVLQGHFLGWQRTGPYYDALMNTNLLRYNAYTGIRNAGVIQVRAVRWAFRIARPRVLAEYVLARMARRAFPPPREVARMPLPVLRAFRPLTALRVLAFLDDDGIPLTLPLLSLQPAGESVLVGAHGLAADWLAPLPAATSVAASLLTLDIVSFQVKGRWMGNRRYLGAPVGGIAVQAVYAGGPPIPGREVAGVSPMAGAARTA